ncbi:hypothetical protein BJV82DRAFT_671897 [Fennellomyces sp. T-0311]|nr:hypothetical protein BJV82DRAFT_671897 [Fennellomyces sp. T-0311]
MARPRGKSLSQNTQPQQLPPPPPPQPSDNEPNVNAQLDYINKIIKWNIQDLDHFINVLNARITAETTYLQALERIERMAPVPEADSRYFGDARTSYQKVTMQYEMSMSRTVNGRRELVKHMKLQLQQLYDVKNTQEMRRKRIKNILGEKNTNYLSFRSRDFVRRHRAYNAKCNEIEVLEDEINAAPATASTTSTAPAQTAGSITTAPTEEPRKSSDSDQSATSSHDTHRRRMAGLKALRTQIVNAMSSNMDPNTRVAKLKREMVDLDREYRKGVVFMERERRKQVETTEHAMKHVEVMILDKAEMTKSVLHNILKVEQEMQQHEATWAQKVVQANEQVSGPADVALFLSEWEKTKTQFDVPEQIYYENRYHGVLKDVQFSTSLESYAKIHQRTVPILVQKCIQAVEEQGGLKKEGIYRVSGRQSNMDALKVDFEKDEMNVNINNYDVFTIASVLKVYLRELEIPLFGLPMRYRAEYSNKDDPTRLRELESNLAELSDAHRDTLRTVIEHLAKVTAHADVNKMNMQNLSLIFTPAIFHDHNNAENAGEWCVDKVFSDLITHHQTLFVTVEAAIAERKKQRQNPQHSRAPLPPAPPPQAPVAIHPNNNDISTASSSITLPSSSLSTKSNSDPVPDVPIMKPPLARSDSRGRTILARKDSLNALKRSPSLLQRHNHKKQQSTSSQKELPPVVPQQPDTPEPSSPTPLV